MNLDRSGPVLCFGEVLLRLSAAAGTRLASSSNFSAHVGGAEANVGALLAQLGTEVELITVLPRSSLGDLCEAELRRVGMGTGKVLRSSGRLGLNFFEAAVGGGRIVYDREYSAFARRTQTSSIGSRLRRGRDGYTCPASIWHSETRRRTRHLRPPKPCARPEFPYPSTSITAHLCGRADRELSSTAFASWPAWRMSCSPTRPTFRACSKSICRKVTSEYRRAAAEAAFNAFEQLQFVASTTRSQEGPIRNPLRQCRSRELGHETAAAPLGTVIDRIGSGDAFAGAAIDAILRRAPLEEIAQRGLAAAVLKHGLHGDRWIGSRAELESFDPFAARDIQR